MLPKGQQEGACEVISGEQLFNSVRKSGELHFT